MRPYYQEPGVTLYHGDCVEVMRSMPDNSVDAIVTDPPYGIRFMGKAWDGADIEKQTERRRQYGNGPKSIGVRGGHNSAAAAAGKYDLKLSANQAFEEWTRIWSTEAFRILKPGGHMLTFCGPRTYHRMASGVEDAGFEIRDQIMWLYGSGFPKSLDISKAIDKAAGAEREVVGFDESRYREINNHDQTKYSDFRQEDYITKATITAPATEAAKQWDGWGTALKPAHEPICVARKPLIGTVAENVLEHGTGGINIDECRIEVDSEDTAHRRNGSTPLSEGGKLSMFKMGGRNPENNGNTLSDKGRFPANLILDPEAGAMLDRQSGDSVSIERISEDHDEQGATFSLGRSGITPRGHNDSGGASRFFYCAKASKADRDEGLEGMEKISTGELQGGRTEGSAGSVMPSDGRINPYAGAGAVRSNHHPTVKPTALMQYLVRLVTPPGGTVLDPFMGSGSTGKACVREGFKFIGIERDEEYLPIAIARINAPAQVELI